MPVILSTIVLPAVTTGLDSCSGLLSTACDRIADHLGRRTAVACLHDLDDRALRDIGLTRFQMEAAVFGRVTHSDKTDELISAAATYPGGCQHAPTLEAAPWS
ncbi:DUF1127 domain-containing protein [Bradyrhizobium sp. CCBAU 051011]|uniref:DUF1127 domain-containing protein n=1 Tax=Bradyrhizobium sp. CCBAU 051011 TaxID=858422 RepID=UPI00137ABC59|nr:DUF1127 domain-containing protein [Bradyrhizobium sp. CCBAU 051011]